MRVISARHFEQGSVQAHLKADWFAHERVAASILEALRILDAGAVVGVCGPWGRGKTDVIARVALKTYTPDGPDFLVPKALWVNPWETAHSGLLTSLVDQLLRRCEENRRTTSGIVAAARRIFAFAARLAPTAGALAAAHHGVVGLSEALQVSNVVDAIIDRSSGPTSAETPRHDSIADDFRLLTDAANPSENAHLGQRLLVCVDDMDRCSPAQQVALMEAIHFMTATGARASFLIALNPILFGDALRAHYKSKEFEPDRYLDKVMDLRVTLPTLTPAEFSAAFMARLDAPIGASDQTLRRLLATRLMSNIQSDDIAFVRTHEVQNPRILHRMCDRLLVAAMSPNQPPASNLSAQARRGAFWWLGLLEGWPDHRAMLRSGSTLANSLDAMVATYASAQPSSATTMGDHGAIVRSDHRGIDPSLRDYFMVAHHPSGGEVAHELRRGVQHMEDFLTRAGL